MKKNKLLLLLVLISPSLLADDSEYEVSTRILSIPTVRIGNELLYEARLKLNLDGLFSIVSYNKTNENQTTFNNSLFITGSGEVVHILPDDLDGKKHQKFILELISGQTILISHNIDIAPRIDLIEKGDTVEFYGEYVWNTQGGLVHWTHHDSSGKHKNGWLKHKNKVYQ